MSFQLDLPSKGQPSGSRQRLASELEQLQHRSTSHLPPTSAAPHIPPVPVRRDQKVLDTKGKAKAAYSLGQAGVQQLQQEAAAGAKPGAALGSPTTSLNSATSKKTVPVKAKQSSKQKRRDREKQQKAADFREKLAVKDEAFETRKLKRDRAKRAWD